MASFPSTLPTLDIVRGTQFQFGNGSLRTDMDQGPAKRRRLTSTDPDVLTLTHPKYTDTEVTELRSFYKTTLAEGTLSFTMANPLTGETDTFAFLTAPSINSAGGIHWSVSVQLEWLP